MRKLVIAVILTLIVVAQCAACAANPAPSPSDVEETPDADISSEIPVDIEPTEKPVAWHVNSISHAENEYYVPGSEVKYAIMFLLNDDGGFLIETHWTDGTFTSKEITEEKYQAILSEPRELDITICPSFEDFPTAQRYSGYIHEIYTKSGCYEIPLTVEEWARDNPDYIAQGCAALTDDIMNLYQRYREDWRLVHSFSDEWHPNLDWCFRNCNVCGQRETIEHDFHEGVCVVCGFDVNS